MATQFFMTDTASDLNLADDERLASLARDAATVASGGVSTVTGPTAGLRLVHRLTPFGQLVWITNPLNAVTISGLMTFNVWMKESAAQANTGAQVIVRRIANDGTHISSVVNSEKGTELGTALAVQNWTATPTSTTLAAGDRLAIEILGNDAGGTMASGRTFDGTYGSPTASVSGDTWVQFNETITEQAAAAADQPYRNPMAQLLAH